MPKAKSITYNKLIRDRIPEIIISTGWKPETKVLKKAEFLRELKRKILEEAKELNEGKGDRNLIEELADIQEIIDAILLAKNKCANDFKNIQRKKRIKRGGFEKRLFLIKTTEKK